MPKIIHINKSQITIEVTIEFKGSIMDLEDRIFDASTQISVLATEKALEIYDNMGKSIKIETERNTSKINCS